MTTSFHMSGNEKLLEHQNKVALKRMQTFQIQTVLFLVLTTSALLCSAPFDYLPQVQECSQTQITIPLTKGTFKLRVSEHPEKSSPFIQALINDKITANIYPEDNSAPIIDVLLAKAGDPLFRDYLIPSSVVEKPESYAIRCFHDHEKNAYTICLVGHDNRGVFYAGATFLQMISNGKIMISDITDYPHWPHRYLSDYFIPTTDQLIRYAAELKYNGFGMQYRSGWQKFGPDNKPPFSKDADWKSQLARLKKFREDTGDLLDFMFVYNIYAGAQSRSFDCANPEHVAQLESQCRFALQSGFTHIMIGVDDFVPKHEGQYDFISNNEKQQFGDVGTAHGMLMKTLSERLRKDFPHAVFAFCPGPYSIDQHDAVHEPARTYLKHLGEQLPEDVYVVWTGRHVVSPRITKADFDEYAALLAPHRKIYTWHNPNNGPYQPGPLDFYPNFQQETNGIMFTNSHDVGVLINRPVGAVYMDYLWNQRDFNEKDAFRRAVRHTLLPDEHAADTYISMLVKYSQSRTTSDRAKKAELLRAVINDLHTLQPFKLPRYDYFEKQYTHELEMATVALPVLEAPHNQLEVTIDGRLNEEAWDHAAVFPLITPDGHPQGDCKILWNEETQTIYLAAILPQPKITGEKLPRDDIMRGHDGIRFFFATPLKHPRYAEIAIDLDGNLRDSIQYVPTWDPKLSYAIGNDGMNGIIELQLPIAVMKNTAILWDSYRLQSGNEWRFQAIRPADATRNTKSHEDAIWAPVGSSSPREIALFGILRFK